jgi:hypothetical protein
MKRSILSLILVGSPASAEPVPRSLRHAAGHPDRPQDQRIRTAVAEQEIAPSQAVDPAIVARVFGAPATLSERPPSVVARPTTWAETRPESKVKLRRRWSLFPIKSLSKGTGGGKLLGLKIRM